MRSIRWCFAYVLFACAPLHAQGIDFLDGDGFEDGCSTDTDADRLPDCFENGSGRFAGPMRAGTSPTNRDTDADGLSDGDEVLGTTAGLNLPAMGAKALRKTVLIEYDWFDDARGCAMHSHRPTLAIINRVADAFTAMPLSNPDGTTGVDAIQDYGQGGLFAGGGLLIDADNDITGGVNGAEFIAFKAGNFASNRFRYFHYTLMPHTYSAGNSSGQAELPGDDLIVSLQCSTSTSSIGNTVIHEIGHNFQLRHGGDTNCNYKPNYNSVMNYRYQFPGRDTNCTVPGDGSLGYSVGTRIPLNEGALNEQAGICGVSSNVPVDWNGNSVIETSVSFDINASDAGQVTSCGGTLTSITDFNDYGLLNLAAVGNANDRGASHEVIDCTHQPPEDD